MFKNDLQIFSKFDDQFNFADSTNGQIIIYSLYRNVYLASSDIRTRFGKVLGVGVGVTPTPTPTP